MPLKCSLKILTNQALKSIDPVRILSQAESHESVLCLGKAALRSWQVLSKGREKSDWAKLPHLVIYPQGAWVGQQAVPHGARWVAGEHPLPGPGSFEAGRALLEFYASLKTSRASSLRVYLSGGASSLMWLPPARIDPSSLNEKLETLYTAGLSIDELNQRRSSLCELKAGGAARWLRRIAGPLSVQVEVISDVAPFGAEVVGSGPFWDSQTPHRVVGANQDLVASAVKFAQAQKIPILAQAHSLSGPWEEWVTHCKRLTDEALRAGRSGLLVFGGEPLVLLPKGIRGGRGGRQTQIALALAIALRDPLAQGKVEWICASSDGVDGRSGSAGAWVKRDFGLSMVRSSSFTQRCVEALHHYHSALPLETRGALLPEKYSGTNVQDLILISVK